MRVATREGGVDRNTFPGSSTPKKSTSPPARVAWIETQLIPGRGGSRYVATREGGVDRNMLTPKPELNLNPCRHPRGWRG